MESEEAMQVVIKAEEQRLEVRQPYSAAYKLITIPVMLLFFGLGPCYMLYTSGVAISLSCVRQAEVVCTDTHSWLGLFTHTTRHNGVTSAAVALVMAKKPYPALQLETASGRVVFSDRIQSGFAGHAGAINAMR
jgi:hypothetical protein